MIETQAYPFQNWWVDEHNRDWRLDSTHILRKIASLSKNRVSPLPSSNIPKSKSPYTTRRQAQLQSSRLIPPSEIPLNAQKRVICHVPDGVECDRNDLLSGVHACGLAVICSTTELRCGSVMSATYLLTKMGVSADLLVFMTEALSIETTSLRSDTPQLQTIGNMECKVVIMHDLVLFARAVHG